MNYCTIVDKGRYFAYNFDMKRGPSMGLLLLLTLQVLHAIEPEDVFHDRTDLLYVNPEAGDIRLRVARDATESVFLLIETQSVEMNIVYQDKDFDYYGVQLHAFDSNLLYKFLLRADGDSLVFTPEGSIRPVSASLSTPSWAEGKIYYSIIIDGFHNGNPLNDPSDKLIWGAVPDEWSSYGGDLRGIIQRIDYINSLGPDIILLSPLFTATSNHKLNPRDYATIDPALGDTTDLKNVINAIHGIGKKVILSIVFTHTGNDFPAFTDIVAKGSASRYSDWYRIQAMPSAPGGIRYRSWRTDPRFPLLNLRNRQLQDYLIGFIDYWAHFGCDGFCIGEADIEEGFGNRLYAQIKEKYPDLLITYGDPRAGSSYAADGHCSRGFSQVLVDYFVNDTITTAEFDSIIHQMLFFNPTQINLNNLIGLVSYTKRIREFADKELLELMYAFVFTFCGSPTLLYGDEFGMTECAPLNWGSFPWSADRQDRDLFGRIQRLIRMRKENPELGSRNFFTLYIDDVNKVYAYDRGGLIVVLNCSPAQSFVELPAWDGTYVELPSGARLTAYSRTLKLSVDPMSYRILKREI
jgi:cyclomaltodextrinase